MAHTLHLGPVLGFREYDKSANQWRISALIVTDKGAKPVLKAAKAEVASPVVLKTHGSRDALRYDIAVAVKDKQQKIEYSIAGEDFDFHVPANGSPSRMAYASCNGFSSQRLIDQQGYSSEAEMNERWVHMSRRHRSTDEVSKLADEGGWKAGPLHLLLMGGDQVYCDGILEDASPAIREWNSSWWQVWKDKTKAPFSNDMKSEAADFYFNTAYISRGWSRPSIKWMLARVPSIMMWDDHDIFDGWGSHPEKLQHCKVWQGIFGIAAENFQVFQLQSKPGTAAPSALTKHSGFTRGFHFGATAILAIDMRSERTMNQVVSEANWKTIFAWLGGLASLPEGERPQHLLVMSSIPVIYASLQGVENLLAAVPGQQELEDDLRDHWCSRLHFNEQVALVKRLFNFAVRCQCRVTILSGDVHVAAWGKVSSSLPEHQAGGQSYASRINQLISSGIVHPPPTAGQAFFIDHLLSGDPPELASGLTADLPNLPGTRARLCASRNWLSLCLDEAKSAEDKSKNGKFLPRLWADWWFEGEDHAPLTLVIHPTGWAEHVAEEFS